MFETVEVSLGNRSYPVHIGENLLAEAGVFCRAFHKGTRCAVVTDSNVAPLYSTPLLESLARSGYRAELIVVPAGEKSKSLTEVEKICDRMIAAGLDRGALVLALGGGVIGDLAGFVASIYFRGLPYVQIPTTIVSQVDSSVGGKSGVNASGGKNLIGSFHQPRAVIADVGTLLTLPEREFNEGFAEVIKHAIIRDAGMFRELENFNRNDLAALIRKNVEIKAAIVSADEHETTGERALLNFGHTIGHGIENAAGYGRYLHWEAISLGIVAACLISSTRATLPDAEKQRILQLLKQFHLPVKLPSDLSTESILTALRSDKKFAEGQIRYILTSGIGTAFVSCDVSLGEIRRAIEDLR
jgi:3-dehydroquinate synthase